MKDETARLLQLAQSAMQRRDLATAAQALERALGLDPRDVEVNMLAATFASQTGQFAAARDCFQTALAGDPNRLDAVHGIAHVLLATGAYAEATSFARRAALMRPKEPAVLNTLGVCLAHMGEVPSALEAFSKASDLAPSVGALWRNKGEMLERLQLGSEAISSYKRAYELDPADMAARLSAAALMMVHGRLSEAAGNAKKALEIQPGNTDALLLSARISTEQRKPEAAEILYRKAVSLNPDSQLAFGIWLIEEGRLADATEMLDAFLRRHPDNVPANYWLSEAHNLKDPEHPVARKLQDLSRQGSISLYDLGFVEFGLGRIYDRAKKFEEAIQHLDKANRLAYEFHFPSPPSLAQITGEVELAESKFGTAEIAKRGKNANASDRPIFIVGMIRSGTTLLEQIVASHPDVAAAGELRFWMEHSSQLWNNPESYANLAEEYLGLLQTIDSDKSHVTDKAPLNYRFLGPLSSVFPNAKFLHIKRNPIDTCLSIYMMAHTKPPPFAYRQDNIVLTYRQYLRMMEHWRKVLPQGQILEVDYQELVTDQEPVTRRIIDFLGLEWSDACLRPEDNAAAVRTPSLMQVRQPVYKSSVDRWRNYEPWLRELLELQDVQ